MQLNLTCAVIIAKMKFGRRLKKLAEYRLRRNEKGQNKLCYNYNVVLFLCQRGPIVQFS